MEESSDWKNRRKAGMLLFVNIVAIFSSLVCSQSASGQQSSKSLPPGHVRGFGGMVLKDPDVTADVIAVKITKVSQRDRTVVAELQYEVLEVFRTHPLASQRIPAKGRAVFAPIRGGYCATGHQYPLAPPLGSSVIVLANNDDGNLSFMNTPVAYPKDREKAVQFVKKVSPRRCETNRGEDSGQAGSKNR